MLALVTILGLLPLSKVQAAQSSDVVYVDEFTSMSELVESGVVSMPSQKGQMATEPYIPQTPLAEDQLQEGMSPAASICSCGQFEEAIYRHSDGCALRQYYIDVCADTVTRIYDLWNSTDAVTRSIPDLKLNRYTDVRIIHVDDQGNDSLITGVVDENGNIVFETRGFDATSLNAVGKVDASKVGAFASSGGFSKRSPAISFKGAFGSTAPDFPPCLCMGDRMSFVKFDER